MDKIKRVKIGQEVRSLGYIDVFIYDFDDNKFPVDFSVGYPNGDLRMFNDCLNNYYKNALEYCPTNYGECELCEKCTRTKEFYNENKEKYCNLSENDIMKLKEIYNDVIDLMNRNKYIYETEFNKYKNKIKINHYEGTPYAKDDAIYVDLNCNKYSTRETVILLHEIGHVVTNCEMKRILKEVNYCGDFCRWMSEYLASEWSFKEYGKYGYDVLYGDRQVYNDYVNNYKKVRPSFYRLANMSNDRQAFIDRFKPFI